MEKSSGGAARLEDSQPTANAPLCRRSGCNNPVEGNKTLCKTHLLKKPKCSVLSCLEEAASGGLCEMHGGFRQMRPKCSYFGCQSTFIVKDGRCSLHMLRDGSRTTEIKAKEHPGNAKRCGFFGCCNVSGEKGLCKRHESKAERCTATGCDWPAIKDSLCSRHGGGISAYSAFGRRASQQDRVDKQPKQQSPSLHMTKDKAAHPLTAAGTKRNDDNSATEAPNRTEASRVPWNLRPLCTELGCLDYATQGDQYCSQHKKVDTSSWSNRKVELQRAASEEPCQVNGCKSSGTFEGFCLKHKPGKREKCSISVCNSEAVNGDLCADHSDLATSSTLCSSLSCTNPAVIHGLCRHHHDIDKECKSGLCTSQKGSGYSLATPRSLSESRPAASSASKQKSREAAACFMVNCRQPVRQHGLCAYHHDERRVCQRSSCRSQASSTEEAESHARTEQANSSSGQEARNTIKDSPPKGMKIGPAEISAKSALPALQERSAGMTAEEAQKVSLTEQQASANTSGWASNQPFSTAVPSARMGTDRPIEKQQDRERVVQHPVLGNSSSPASTDDYSRSSHVGLLSAKQRDNVVGASTSRESSTSGAGGALLLSNSGSIGAPNTLGGGGDVDQKGNAWASRAIGHDTGRTTTSTLGDNAPTPRPASLQHGVQRPSAPAEGEALQNPVTSMQSDGKEASKESPKEGLQKPTPSGAISEDTTQMPPSADPQTGRVRFEALDQSEVTSQEPRASAFQTWTERQSADDRIKQIMAKLKNARLVRNQGLLSANSNAMDQQQTMTWTTGDALQTAATGLPPPRDPRLRQRERAAARSASHSAASDHGASVDDAASRKPPQSAEIGRQMYVEPENTFHDVSISAISMDSGATSNNQSQPGPSQNAKKEQPTSYPPNKDGETNAISHADNADKRGRVQPVDRSQIREHNRSVGMTEKASTSTQPRQGEKVTNDNHVLSSGEPDKSAATSSKTEGNDISRSRRDMDGRDGSWRSSDQELSSRRQDRTHGSRPSASPTAEERSRYKGRESTEYNREKERSSSRYADSPAYRDDRDHRYSGDDHGYSSKGRHRYAYERDRDDHYNHYRRADRERPVYDTRERRAESTSEKGLDSSSSSRQRKKDYDSQESSRKRYMEEKSSRRSEHNERKPEMSQPKTAGGMERRHIKRPPIAPGKERSSKDSRDHSSLPKDSAGDKRNSITTESARDDARRDNSSLTRNSPGSREGSSAGSGAITQSNEHHDTANSSKGDSRKAGETIRSERYPESEPNDSRSRDQGTDEERRRALKRLRREKERRQEDNMSQDSNQVNNAKHQEPSISSDSSKPMASHKERKRGAEESSISTAEVETPTKKDVKRIKLIDKVRRAASDSLTLQLTKKPTRSPEGPTIRSKERLRPEKSDVDTAKGGLEDKRRSGALHSPTSQQRNLPAEEGSSSPSTQKEKREEQEVETGVRGERSLDTPRRPSLSTTTHPSTEEQDNATEGPVLTPTDEMEETEPKAATSQRGAQAPPAESPSGSGVSNDGGMAPEDPATLLNGAQESKSNAPESLATLLSNTSLIVAWRIDFDFGSEERQREAGYLCLFCRGTAVRHGLCQRCLNDYSLDLKVQL